MEVKKMVKRVDGVRQRYTYQTQRVSAKRRESKPDVMAFGSLPEGITAKEEKAVVTDLVEGITSDLKKEGRAKVKDLGIFTVKNIPAKKGGEKKFMPMLGKEIVTKAKPASKKVKFRPSKNLKEAI